MIGIGAIGCYVPKKRLSNLERSEEFGISEDFIESKLGDEGLHRDP